MAKRTSRAILEFQSDRIEAVLAQHKVSAKVTGGAVSPRWVQFRVMPALGARVNKIKGLAEELALALDSETCRVTRQGGTVSVEIPRSDPQTVKLLPLQRRLGQQGNIPFGAAVLGIAEDGAPLLVRLPSPQVAHILIAGTTGSGKSALAKTIIASLALGHRPSQVGFVLIDPKRRAFGAVARLPHLLRPVLSEPNSVVETLDALVELMLDRDRRGCVPASAGQNGESRVVVVIDELADLLMMAGRRIQDALTRLTQRGREAGIHLVASTQKPASQVVGSLAKANFPVRLVGRVTSPEDAKVATGYAATGAERLRGPGDFIAVSSGRIMRFQAAFIGAQELTNLMTRAPGLERANGPNRVVADPAQGATPRHQFPFDLGRADGFVQVKRMTDRLRRRIMD
jgi:S-DNA-T family DNA segregation ATPase FtsK/SpoIIIE